MTTLYRLYDRADRLLYIGIADKWTGRFEKHHETKPWWSEVTDVKLEHYPTRTEAAAAEVAAIRREHPVHNIQHNSRPPQKPAYEFVWFCDYCDRAIDNRQGYLELPWHEAARHRRELAQWRERHPEPEEDESTWRPIDMAAVLDSPEPQHWHVTHVDCDPDPDSSGYHIGVERIRTFKETLDWTFHLEEKNWYHDTDWPDFIQRRRITPPNAGLNDCIHDLNALSPPLEITTREARQLLRDVGITSYRMADIARAVRHRRRIAADDAHWRI